MVTNATEMQRLIVTDNLTGLYARHYLNEQIDYFAQKDSHYRRRY